MNIKAVPPVQVNRVGNTVILSIREGVRNITTSALTPWGVIILATGAQVIPQIAFR